MTAIYLPQQPFIPLRLSDLEALKQKAQEAPLRRCRYCLHADHSDPVQEMMIAFCRDSYVRPHRHRNKTESFHLIEGELLIVQFDDQGHIQKGFRMSPWKEQGISYFRLTDSSWHMVIPLTEFALLHEITKGPFRESENEWAPWAPANEDQEQAQEFIARIRREFVLWEKKHG